MTEIEEKLKEIELKDKRNNLIYSIVVVLILVLFGLLYNNSVQSKKIEALEIANRELETQKFGRAEEERLACELEIRRFDSIRKIESVKVVELQKQIKALKDANGGRASTKAIIEPIAKEIEKIKTINSARTLVTYYKRSKDNTKIGAIINGIKSPKFKVDYKPSSRDDGVHTVNTIRYGELVDPKIVDALAQNLKRNSIEITKIQPYEDRKESAWKNSTIELLYEPLADNLKSNSSYHIRLYGYSTDKVKKKDIQSFLSYSGYQVVVYPDWEVEESFFSKTSTVLYYSDNTRARAKRIAEFLADKTGINFKYSKGGGYGVSNDEKEHLFIIHYNGSQR